MLSATVFASEIGYITKVFLKAPKTYIKRFQPLGSVVT